MSATLENITRDLTVAMKAKDTLSVSVLRQLIGEIRSAEKAGKVAKEFSEAEVLNLLAKEVKKRLETADIYTQAGRPELAERENAEVGVIRRYLPEPLGGDELAELVRKAIADTGAAGVKEMGKVIKLVTAQTSGRADGRAVSAEVKRQLS